MRARRVSRRWKNRQCRSVHSIIGAIQNFRSKPFILLAISARSSGLERLPNRAGAFPPCASVLLRSSWREWEGVCRRRRPARARCAHDEAGVSKQRSRCSVAEGAASRVKGIGNESVSRFAAITLTCKSFAFPRRTRPRGTTRSGGGFAALTPTALIATGRSVEAPDAGRQAEGRTVVDRRVGRLDHGQGRRRAHERLARAPLRGSSFSDRRRPHRDDLFCSADFGQTCRRRTPLWPW